MHLKNLFLLAAALLMSFLAGSPARAQNNGPVAVMEGQNPNGSQSDTSAIVVTRDVKLYAAIAAPDSFEEFPTIGTLKAGEHTCLRFATDGPNGYVMLIWPDNDAVEAKNSNDELPQAWNDGSFAPDPSNAAGCDAVALTSQNLATNAPAPVNLGAALSSESSLLEWLGVGVIVVALITSTIMWMTRHQRRRANEEAAQKAQYRAGMTRRTMARWPIPKFPRIEKEDNFEIWEAMLGKWPTPPESEEKRIENEKLFWDDEKRKFLVDGDEKRLQPKQKIMDFYIEFETWIVRDYFAATGIYIEPYLGPEYERLLLKAQRAAQWSDEFKDTKIHQATMWSQKQNAEGDRKAADEKLEDYISKGKKEHFEKWTGWYFMKIELAFSDVQPDDFGPGSAHSPADHPAGDGLEYKPAT